MITAGLEQLILEGKARYKSINCVYSGLVTLPVRELTWIVITDFIFFGFHERGASPKGTPVLEKNSVNHFIRFDSNSGQYDFIHRTDHIETYNREGTPKFNTVGHTVFNCYQIHSSTVRLLVLRIPTLHQTIINWAAVPRITNEPNNPLGYEQDALVYAARLVPGGVDSGNYYTNAIRHPVLPLPPTFKNTFGLNVNPETELVQPADPDEYSYPMIQISYVEIRGEIPDSIKGSK